MEDGESQTPGWLGPARQHYLLRGLPVGTQAKGGGPGARRGGAEVSPQEVKGHSDFD